MAASFLATGLLGLGLLTGACSNDAGGKGGSGGGTSGVRDNCARLSDCCAQPNVADPNQCNQVAGAGNLGDCSKSLTQLVSDGSCTLGTSSGATSGSTSGTGGPQCSPGGAACQSFQECCSGTCAKQICTSCQGAGQPCDTGSCCNGLSCNNGACSALSCKADAMSCTLAAECCSDVCTNGLCVGGGETTASSSVGGGGTPAEMECALLAPSCEPGFNATCVVKLSGLSMPAIQVMIQCLSMPKDGFDCAMLYDYCVGML